jgi:hypothetical protein
MKNEENVTCPQWTGILHSYVIALFYYTISTIWEEFSSEEIPQNTFIHTEEKDVLRVFEE